MKTFIIAEVGINHNGDIKIAKENEKYYKEGKLFYFNYICSNER